MKVMILVVFLFQSTTLMWGSWNKGGHFEGGQSDHLAMGFCRRMYSGIF